MTIECLISSCGGGAFGFHFARFDSNVLKELISSKLKVTIGPYEIKKAKDALLLWEEPAKISQQGRPSRQAKYGSDFICIPGDKLVFISNDGGKHFFANVS